MADLTPPFNFKKRYNNCLFKQFPMSKRAIMRKASVQRNTLETQIQLTVNLDGTGTSEL